MADVATLIAQAKAELLNTTKPGQWYAQNRSAPGHWTNAFSLLDQATAASARKPKSVAIDGSGAPTLKAIVVY